MHVLFYDNYRIDNLPFYDLEEREQTDPRAEFAKCNKNVDGNMWPQSVFVCAPGGEDTYVRVCFSRSTRKWSFWDRCGIETVSQTNVLFRAEREYV